MPTKRVLLMIVDGLSRRVIEPAVKSGRLPFFAELAERGCFEPCASIFPSITPAATAALVTGKTPREHGIQGAFWYDRDRKDVCYFGDSLRVALREGLSEYVEDYLRTLNDELLRCPTLFEQAQQAGLTAAGLNLMWRRGQTKHEVSAPLLMKLLPGVRFDGDIKGPDYLFLGEFVATDLPGVEPPEFPRGVANRYGFNDRATLAQLRSLLASDAAPQLTVAYFPDNDFRSHEVGPAEALPVVIELDESLTKLAKTRGGIDSWLEEMTLIVVGDHGHDNLLEDQDESAIDLGRVLDDYEVAPAGAEGLNGEDLLVCPNMRSAQISLNSACASEPSEVAQRILAEPRVDQVIYQLHHGGDFEVHTKDRGALTFREAVADAVSESGVSRSGIVTDSWGRDWIYRGDLAAVDAQVDEHGQLSYGEYPDALARIAEGAPALQDSLWITSRPGYQFTLYESAAHERGSHGSLHRLDSETVFFAARLPPGVDVGAVRSITDVAPLCRRVLQLNSE